MHIVCKPRPFDHFLAAHFLAFSCLLAFAGCDKNAVLTSLPGQYQGLSLLKRNGKTSQHLVTTEIQLKSKTELEIRSSSVDKDLYTTLKVLVVNPTKIRLFLPNWENAEIVLNKDSEKCFVSKSAPDKLSAVICQNGIDITIDLNWGMGGNAFTLSLSRTLDAQHPVFESPQSYSIDELITRAMNQNFTSPVQFEHVTQAKLKTQEAYLNLLPHFSINTALNIASLNLYAILKTVGDVVPFLFPTRWLQAKEAKYRTEAEFDAWILTKANAANIAEGLAYQVRRDEMILAILADNGKLIHQIKDKTKVRETERKMQVGTTDDFDYFINEIDKTTLFLESTLEQEKIALAQAAGFNNFAAITHLKPITDITLDDVKPYEEIEFNHLSYLAIDRSYELRQLNALIEAARIGLTERYFQWLDPAGDTGGGLGINLVPYIKIGKSQIQELIDKRQQLEVELIDSMARSLNTSNEILVNHHLVQKGLTINNRRIDRHMLNMSTGAVFFSISDLTTALQMKVKSEMDIVNLQCAYYIARANINRYLLAGPYTGLPVDKGQEKWVVSFAVETFSF